LGGQIERKSFGGAKIKKKKTKFEVKFYFFFFWGEPWGLGGPASPKPFSGYATVHISHMAKILNINIKKN
jgi:hypothetical protein